MQKKQMWKKRIRENDLDSNLKSSRDMFGQGLSGKWLIDVVSVDLLYRLNAMKPFCSPETRLIFKLN